MAEHCELPVLRERALSGESLDAGEQARWRRHVAACSACHTQAAVDDGLRRMLAAATPPPLPDGFVERFEKRRRAAVGSAAGRLWLRAYWIGFALVSIQVLSGVDWARFHAWLPALGAVWLGVLVASPVLALIGPLRTLIGICALGAAEHRSQREITA
jgi:anti-sigma factor RsiW